MDDRLILALDQGTTGSTALLVDASLRVLDRVNREFPQIYPQPGWVEHDPEAIYGSVLDAVDALLERHPEAGQRIAAIGITNQRETTLLWDRTTSEPVHNAIVWQCRRTADRCDALRAAGHEEQVRDRTGLVLDAYFSGTKLAWLLDEVDGARARAEQGALAFGTVDSWLVWRMTRGERHVTDTTNASRTLLFNLRELDWDDSLLELLNIPRDVLPEVCSSSEIYGHTDGVRGLPDGIPIAGIAGDQQAALFGQACFVPGEMKCTYGTGAFLLQNVGGEPVPSRSGLLTTVAWTLGEETTYALEGSVFIAGAAVQWLRDELQLIDDAPAVEALAASAPSSDGVVVVPAFVGLGAPHWNSQVRGGVFGLTRGAGRPHLARATLEGIALSCGDLIDAMSADAGHSIPSIRVDGGAAQNDLLMQLQADVAGVEVVRPSQLETTALGAACLAGLATGIFAGLDDVRDRWQRDREFTPAEDRTVADGLKARWRRAIKALAAFGA